jgi:two-component system response regulator YesN
MYKLLIADDEIMMREGLKKHFQQTGIFDVELAENGEDAVAMLRSNCYDAVILDIVMPTMTGLEVLDKISDIASQPVKVIMSGYDRFEYAQESISYGVSEFILKPMTPDIISDLIERLTFLINNKKNLELRERNISKQLENMKPVLKERFLGNLVSSTNLPSDIEERFQNYDLNFPYPFFRCAKFSLEMLPGRNDTYAVRTINRKLAMDMLEENCREGLIARTFAMPGDTVGVIFNVLSLGDDIDEELLSLATEVKSAFNVELVCGVGNAVGCLADVKSSFVQAQNAFAANHSMRFSPLLYYTDLGESYDALSEDLSYEEIYQSIKSGESDEVIARIKSICTRRTEASDYNAIKLLIIKVVFACQSILRSFALEMDSEKLKPLFGIITGEPGDSNRCIVDMLIDFIDDTLVKIADLRANKMNYIIERAKKIIEDSYMTDISVSSIADQLGISKNYCGKLFKIHTGISISNYVNSIRVKKAAELLQNTNMKVYEIGEAVGYNDQHYFSIVFKKTIGVSPSEFRDLM